MSSSEAGSVSSGGLHTGRAPGQDGMPKASATLSGLVMGTVTWTCPAGEQSRYSPRPGWGPHVTAHGAARHTGPQSLPRHGV